MNLLAGLIQGQVDERIHSLMTRYGRGTFQGPASESQVSGKRLVTSGSYMYVPTLGQLLATTCQEDLAVKGLIISKADITEEIEEHGLDVLDAKKRGGFKFRVEGDLPPAALLDVYEDFWDVAVLLKARAPKMSLSTGSSVPKPKKASDPTFAKLTLPATEETRASTLEALAPGFGARSFENLSVRHTIRIDELIIPGEATGKPASVLRMAAKRRGVLERQVTLDGEETEEEFEIMA
jgi:hypothetical protein